MPALREQILAAVFAKLQSIASPAGLKVYRNKTTDVDAYPSLVLLDGGHEVLSDQTQFPRYRMSVGVQGYVRSKSEDLIGGLINELYVAIVVALTAAIFYGAHLLGVAQFPLVIALLFAIVIALPLGIWLFGPLRRRATASVAAVDERRRQDRADLQARLRGEPPSE